MSETDDILELNDWLEYKLFDSKGYVNIKRDKITAVEELDGKTRIILLNGFTYVVEEAYNNVIRQL